MEHPVAPAGIPDAATRRNPADLNRGVLNDRLILLLEAGRDVLGFRSKTSIYTAINDGSLPKPIKRGSRSYFFESDLLAYLQRLAAQRELP